MYSIEINLNRIERKELFEIDLIRWKGASRKVILK